MSVPSPARRLAVTMLAALPWLVVLFQFLTILPAYDRMFRRFGLKVDDFTGVFLNMSRWLMRNTVIAFCLTFALVGVSVLTAHTVQSADVPKGRRAVALVFVFGFPCLVFVMAWLGVLNTHRTLVEGLQK